MNKFLQGIALFGISIVALIFKLFVLIKMWGYIAVPLGAPNIGYMSAFGISFIVTLLLPMPGDHKEKDTELAVKKIAFSFINSLLTWGFGYFLFG